MLTFLGFLGVGWLLNAITYYDTTGDVDEHDGSTGETAIADSIAFLFALIPYFLIVIEMADIIRRTLI